MRFLQWIDPYGTLPGLVLTYVVHGVSVTTLILRNFNINISGSIVEVAAADCEGAIGVYWRVILPLFFSAFAATLVIQFTLATFPQTLTIQREGLRERITIRRPKSSLITLREVFSALSPQFTLATFPQTLTIQPQVL